MEKEKDEEKMDSDFCAASSSRHNWLGFNTSIYPHEICCE